MHAKSIQKHVCLPERETPLRVIYFASNDDSFPFWKLLRSFMYAVAQDLNIDLTIKTIDLNSRNRFFISDFMYDTLREQPKFDVVMGPLYFDSEQAVLKMLSHYKVPYFSINTSLEQETLARIGLPRQQYPLWLGHMSPNDVKAGYDLIHFLLKNFDQAPYLVALAAGHRYVISNNRQRGLAKAAKEFNLSLRHQYYVNWRYQQAKKATTRALQRDISSNIFWGVNDKTALGMVDAIQEKGGRLNENIRVGTMDWSDLSLQMLEKNQLYVTYGSHFMEAGWALILMHDYLRGIDFKPDLGVYIETELQPLHRGNLAFYKYRLQYLDWTGINFKLLSKCFNPQLERYHFSPEIIAIYKQDKQETQAKH